MFNLVAHNSYRRVPNYRELGPHDEAALLEKGLNRVTDTCIPEHEAMRKIEKKMLALWHKAYESKQRFLPHEYFYQLLRSKELEPEYEIDPKNSWLLAAAEKNLPLFVPGWEDSTLGNMFVAGVIRGEYEPHHHPRWHGVHGRAHQLVQRERRQPRHRLLPDRRRYLG